MISQLLYWHQAWCLDLVILLQVIQKTKNKNKQTTKNPHASPWEAAIIKNALFLLVLAAKLLSWPDQVAMETVPCWTAWSVIIIIIIIIIIIRETCKYILASELHCSNFCCACGSCFDLCVVRVMLGSCSWIISMLNIFTLYKVPFELYVGYNESATVVEKQG